jgi:transposase-like protein
MAGGSKRYSKKFKINALLLLQNNGFNQSRTARELNINLHTLRKWRELLGAEVYDKSDLSEDDKNLLPIERASKVTVLRNNMMQAEEEFLTKVYDVRNKAVDRLLEIVGVSKNPRDLTDVLRISQEIVTGEHIKSLEERKHNANYFNVVLNQFTVNNNKNEGKENDVDQP